MNPNHPGILIHPLLSSSHSPSPLSASCLWFPSGYLISSFLRAVSVMSGQLPVVGGGAPVAGSRVPGGQRPPEIAFAVAGLKAENLYDIPQVARTQPEPSMSGSWPLPKRCRHAPAAVLSLTARDLEATAPDPSAQEHKVTAPYQTVQEFEGGMSEQIALNCLSPHRGQYTCWDGANAYQNKW